MSRKRRIVMERMVPIEECDRSFDIEFWLRQDSAARFAAAWEMVVFAQQIKGQPVLKLRLQRTVENLQRREG